MTPGDVLSAVADQLTPETWRKCGQYANDVLGDEAGCLISQLLDVRCDREARLAAEAETAAS